MHLGLSVRPDSGTLVRGSSSSLQWTWHLRGQWAWLQPSRGGGAALLAQIVQEIQRLHDDSPIIRSIQLSSKEIDPMLHVWDQLSIQLSLLEDYEDAEDLVAEIVAAHKALPAEQRHWSMPLCSQ